MKTIQGKKWWREEGFQEEGWITREGVFIAVFRFDVGPTHSDVANWELGGDGEAKADVLGWLRISDYGDRCAKSLSQKQRDRLFDYCQHHSADYLETLKAISYL